MNRRDALTGLASFGAAALLPGRAVGAPVAALPGWVPGAGLRADISLNRMADVDPCPRRDCIYSGHIGQRAVITAWSGAAFATHYGKLGAWITTGGGHGDYYGNEVYAFELDTRRWVRVNDPYSGGPESSVDYEEGEYVTDVPLSAHAYQHTQYLPPDLGGGPKGSLLMVVKYAAGKLARGSGRAHACDLATGRWSRYSLNRARERLQSTSSTAFDPKRKGYWRVPYGGDVLEFLDTRDRRWRTVNVSQRGAQFGLDHVCGLDPVRDMLVVLDWTRAGGRTWGLALDTLAGWRRLDGGGTGAIATATSPERLLPPATRGMSIEWCPPLDAFVCYEGRLASHVRRLHPPARTDAGAGTWHWVTEEIGGAPPAGRAGTPALNYSRFRFAPSIGCFIWADGRDLPVQAWRLRGS